MAPDIDNALRWMGPLPSDETETKVSEKPAAGEDTSSSSSSSLSSDDDHRPPRSSVRLLRPNEVAIDGIVYDIDSFRHVHPGGGDVIMMFGGMDATVAYRMIHPHHHADHRLAAAKLPVVATIPNHAPEFDFDSAFARELKREVWSIVPHRQGFATRGYACRALLYIGLYVYCQFRWIRCGSTIPLAVAYGIAKALIGLNVQHDANHGSISSDRPYINRLLGLFADGIGGSQWLWNQQHWTHHAYTNDARKDPDANAGRPFLRLHDGQPSRSWHRFQATYLLFIFALYWLAEVWNPNVWNVQARGVLARENAVVDQSKASDFWHRQRRNTVLLRIIYIAIHFGVPIYHHGVVIGLSHCLILGATGSLLLAGLFTLSHNFVGANRYPRQRSASIETVENDDGDDDQKKKVLPCWYRLQVETSCTYGGCWAGYLTGGLNYQIEHHLFPRLNSAWYPYISPIVRDVCRRHGVRYMYFSSLGHNAISSYSYIRAAGGGGDGDDGAGTTNTEDDERRRQKKKKMR